MDFDTERHAVTVTHKGKEVTYYIRELGYYEFQELNHDAARVYPDANLDKEQRGRKLMHDTAIAAIEDKDGNPAFSMVTWKRLPKDPAKALTYAAMKAQGIDLQKAVEEGAEVPAESTEESEVGNA